MNSGVKTITWYTNDGSCTPTFEPDPDVTGACYSGGLDYLVWVDNDWDIADLDFNTDCDGLSTDGFSFFIDTDDPGIITDKNYNFIVYGITYRFSVYIYSVCTFTDYVTSAVTPLTDFDYNRDSGEITKNFDVITGTTGDSCADYTAWTWYLSAELSGTAVVLSDIGVSLDNTVDPAIIKITGDTGQDTNVYTMTWYALPDDNTGHSEITKTFTITMYTALTDVTDTIAIVRTG